MGLFNNYSKPGPGVSKDAPKKKGIFLYFELLGRKFSKLFNLNLLYFVCSLPMFILYFLIYFFTTFNLVGLLKFSYEEMILAQSILSLFLSSVSLLLLGSGPASAAMAYVLREYSKEEHVWLMSTFFSKMKENFKQEMIVTVIDLVFVFLASFAFIFYFTQAASSLVYLALLILLVIFSLVFTCAHFYIHQLIVTFENSLKDIFKNALLLTLSSLYKNILFTALFIGILYLTYVLHPVVALLLYAVILISVLRFGVEFNVHSVIRKTVPAVREAEEKEIDEESLFEDSHRS